MNCNNCDKEFKPKQRFCCTTCRVTSHKNGNVPVNIEKKSNDNVIVNPVTKTEYKVVSGKIKKESTKPPFEFCPKHKVFYKSCGC